MANSHSEKPPARALKPRKTPTQSRSEDTVNVILEGAAHILEAHGLSGYNTNRIAERAGVSIGSLYQYFPSKDAVTSALIEREEKILLEEVKSALLLQDVKGAFSAVIKAAIFYQLRRPTLAKLLDDEEIRLAKILPPSENACIVHSDITQFLTQNHEVNIQQPQIAATDIMEIIRALTDAAGKRAEVDAFILQKNIERAVFGYLDLR